MVFIKSFIKSFIFSSLFYITTKKIIITHNIVVFDLWINQPYLFFIVIFPFFVLINLLPFYFSIPTNFLISISPLNLLYNYYSKDFFFKDNFFIKIWPKDLNLIYKILNEDLNIYCSISDIKDFLSINPELFFSLKEFNFFLNQKKTLKDILKTQENIISSNSKLFEYLTNIGNIFYSNKIPALFVFVSIFLLYYFCNNWFIKIYENLIKTNEIQQNQNEINKDFFDLASLQKFIITDQKLWDQLKTLIDSEIKKNISLFQEISDIQKKKQNLIIEENIEIIDTLKKIQTNFSLIQDQTSINMKALLELKSAIECNRKFSKDMSINELKRSELLERDLELLYNSQKKLFIWINNFSGDKYKDESVIKYISHNEENSQKLFENFVKGLID